MNTMGLAGIGMGSIVFLVLMLVGGVTKDLAVPLMMWLMGGAAIASSAVTLPSWAREREAQMEYIANQAVLLVGPPAPVDQPD